jgi:hypothetical protein
MAMTRLIAEHDAKAVATCVVRTTLHTNDDEADDRRRRR